MLKTKFNPTLIPSRCKTALSHNDAGYQFLHRSKLPTMYFQPSLRRLPIPQVEKTCDRYLAALRPLLIDESFRKTEDVVSKFRAGSGPQLQKLLKDWDDTNKHTSYICQPWFEMYLADRAPLPLNYNPLLVMKHDQKPAYNDQLVRASNLVISSLRFMRSLRVEILEPEVYHMNPKKSDTDRYRQICKLAPISIATYVSYAFKAFPLDMSQYNGLFGATRIPEPNKDRIYRAENSRHLVVMRRGNFFTVDVLDESGDIEAPAVIMARLQAVLQADCPRAEHPLGVLTATDRNAWADARQHLTAIGNAEQLEKIDSALFCLSLEDEVGYDDANPVPLLKHFIAGDASNRWFDKSVSLLLEKDGTAAINFEHSWGDGVAVLRYFNEIYNDSINKPFVHPDTTPKRESVGTGVQQLSFHIDDTIKEAIKTAKASHLEKMSSLDIDFIRQSNISKNVCKQQLVSPDSVMQLSFQLAYKQGFDKYVSSYESCSTAAFRHGRTETMRPCTVASKKFCDSILTRSDLKPDMKQLGAMMKECSAVHGNLIKEASLGQGFDRHLFGLKHMAETNGMEVPRLYSDAGYQILNYNIISTSTLGSPALLAGAFGPVVSDGLGIAYSIMNDECGAVVTSYKGQKSGKKFVENLSDAFNKIHNILSLK